jgi:CheY-like chemotaxis protein
MAEHTHGGRQRNGKENGLQAVAGLGVQCKKAASRAGSRDSGAGRLGTQTDIALIDWYMPEPDGMALCKWIKALQPISEAAPVRLRRSTTTQKRDNGVQGRSGRLCHQGSLGIT